MQKNILSRFLVNGDFNLKSQQEMYERFAVGLAHCILVTGFLAVHSQLCPLRIFFSFGPDGLGPGKNEVPPDWPQEPTFFCRTL